MSDESLNMSAMINRLLIIACSAVLLLAVTVSDTRAQVHRVEVTGGQVVVDGKPLHGSAVAPSFDAGRLQASFVLEGNDHAYLHIGQTLYRVSAEGVQEVGPAERLHHAENARQEGRAVVRFAAEERPVSRQAEVSMIAEQAEVLRERARELQRMTFDLQQTRMQSNQLFDMIESIQRSAAETEQVARSLPHLQAQRYMQEMRERNTELYERLVREQSLERETLDLSQQIRTLSEGAERDQLIERLRSRLEEIFGMKQDNRRQEIAELEERLSSLQRRLEKRERYFEYIVDRRLKELIGDEDEQP